jgi:hypothetical protein
VRRYIRRPSAALVVACVALLVALGGTSVAAVSQLARNSVGTLQLRDNAVTAKKLWNSAVTNPKLANNAVTASKVRNGSLLAADFAAGQIPAGPRGPAGPQGAPGAQGPPGPQGRWAHVLAPGVIAAQSGGSRSRKVVARSGS